MSKKEAKAHYEFSLTFEQFQYFCCKYDYIKGKGKTSESYSIDRIDNSKGYTIDNIRILTLSENSKKGVKLLDYDWYMDKAIVHTLTTDDHYETPF